MGKCETSKGIFLIHQCGNDTNNVCKRCGKSVCNEHSSESTAGTMCAACFYDQANCQTSGDNDPQSVIRRFFGEIGVPANSETNKVTVKNFDTEKLTDIKSREQYLASIRKTVDSPIAGVTIGVAAVAATPLVAHELFPFENVVSDITDPHEVSKGAGFTDS
jgi:23S rRNA A1618 N6-methylase RlmF